MIELDGKERVSLLCSKLHRYLPANLSRNGRCLLYLRSLLCDYILTRLALTLTLVSKAKKRKDWISGVTCKVDGIGKMIDWEIGSKPPLRHVQNHLHLVHLHLPPFHSPHLFIFFFSFLFSCSPPFSRKKN